MYVFKHNIYLKSLHLESFKESFARKLNGSGTRGKKDPVLSGSLEPVPTPSYQINNEHFCNKGIFLGY